MHVLISLLVVTLATVVAVHSASIGTAHVAGGTCADIPSFMFTCDISQWCNSDEECMKFGSNKRCCTNPCGFKSCVTDIVQNQAVYSQQLPPPLDRQECPFFSSLLCAEKPPCFNDYQCSQNQPPPNVVQPPPPNNFEPGQQAVDKCCPSDCGRLVCTKVTNVPFNIPSQAVPCPPVSRVRCYPWFCGVDEHCTDGEICCCSSCGIGLCTPPTSPSFVSPISVEKMSNRTALIARLQAALVQQNLLQCPFVCESMPTPEMRCARSSNCTFQGLKCCPNACGQGRICTRPVSRAAVMAERKKDRTETDEHRIDEQPTTVSANPPNLEDTYTLIKLLAEKLEN